MAIWHGALGARPGVSPGPVFESLAPHVSVAVRRPIPVLGKRCERARRARIGSGAGTGSAHGQRQLLPDSREAVLQRRRSSTDRLTETWGSLFTWPNLIEPVPGPFRPPCSTESADCVPPAGRCIVRWKVAVPVAADAAWTRRARIAAEARDRRDLTVRLRDRSAHPAPGGCDPGIRARGAAVEGQDTVCKARSQHPFEPRRQTVPADTTFVSSTTIAAFSIELRRLAHRFTRRQFEFCSAEGSKALANETCQVLGFGQRLTLERGAPARRVATRSNSPRSTNGW